MPSASNSLVLAQIHKMGFYKEIANVHLHDLYRDVYSDHDIGLVMVKTKFEWSASVKPACLPATDYEEDFPNRFIVSVKKNERFTRSMVMPGSVKGRLQFSFRWVLILKRSADNWLGL